MVSSVEPAAAGVLIPLQMGAGAGSQDVGGARMFADLMKGVSASAHGGAGTVSNPTPTASATTELAVQLSGMQDPTDPIKAQYVMMDVLGQRMEFLGRMHATVAVTSGFTGIFKQLFNRHD
jgi:hypothetical protein